MHRGKSKKIIIIIALTIIFIFGLLYFWYLSSQAPTASTKGTSAGKYGTLGGFATWMKGKVGLSTGSGNPNSNPNLEPFPTSGTIPQQGTSGTTGTSTDNRNGDTRTTDILNNGNTTSGSSVPTGNSYSKTSVTGISATKFGSFNTDQNGPSNVSGTNTTSTPANPDDELVLTMTATSVTKTTATLNAEYDSKKHPAFSAWFEYGDTAPTGTYGKSTVKGKGAKSFAVKGLKPGTTYDFRFVGQTSLGRQEGDTLAFTTPSDNPSDPKLATITTQGATNITTTSATISGTYNGNGEAGGVTTWFEFGSDNYDGPFQKTLQPASSSTQSDSLDLVNLEPNTTYYYYFSGQTAGGVSDGRTLYFTTKSTPAKIDPCTASNSNPDNSGDSNSTDNQNASQIQTSYFNDSFASGSQNFSGGPASNNSTSGNKNTGGAGTSATGGTTASNSTPETIDPCLKFSIIDQTTRTSTTTDLTILPSPYKEVMDDYLRSFTRIAPYVATQDSIDAVKEVISEANNTIDLVHQDIKDCVALTSTKDFYQKATQHNIGRKYNPAYDDQYSKNLFKNGGQSLKVTLFRSNIPDNGFGGGNPFDSNKELIQYLANAPTESNNWNWGGPVGGYDHPDWQGDSSSAQKDPLSWFFNLISLTEDKDSDGNREANWQYSADYSHHPEGWDNQYETSFFTYNSYNTGYNAFHYTPDYILKFEKLLGLH
jgi:hypothetical protein